MWSDVVIYCVIPVVGLLILRFMNDLIIKENERRRQMFLESGYSAKCPFCNSENVVVVDEKGEKGTLKGLKLISGCEHFVKDRNHSYAVERMGGGYDLVRLAFQSGIRSVSGELLKPVCSR